jgi:hypothetical protein
LALQQFLVFLALGDVRNGANHARSLSLTPDVLAMRKPQSLYVICPDSQPPLHHSFVIPDRSVLSLFNDVLNSWQIGAEASAPM